MEKKQSKVSSVTANGTWTGKYGLMYKWEVSLENGDQGECMTQKETPPFLTREVADYEIHSREYNGNTYFTIKKVREEFQPGKTFQKDPKTSEQIVRMSVLKAATDLVISEQIKLEEIILYSMKFEAYVKGESEML